VPFENSKEWREHNTCILHNQLYRFSHQIPSYKMIYHRNECIPRGCFELNFTVLQPDKFQLTEEHDPIQRNLLEVHSRHHRKECIPRGCFELNHTALLTDKFQLREEHDQAQKNLLEVHSLLWHSSYTNEFDVVTHIANSAEYMLCSLNLLTFQRGLQITTFSIRHFNTNIFSKLTRIKLKFQQNKDMMLFKHNFMAESNYWEYVQEISAT
jgi:hypothetical protein